MAAGMLAPESSVRRPLMAPVDDWAAAKEAAHAIPKDKSVSLRK
jgi:hypothetical protein